MSDENVTYEFGYLGEDITLQADNGNSMPKITKGGYYKGKITGCKFKKGKEGTQKLEMEMEITSNDGESTGKCYFLMRTNAGSTVDKNGKELGDRSKISALCALTKTGKITTGVELVGKPIGILVKIVNSYDNEYRNCEILNFIDPETNKTFTEKIKDLPAEKYLSKIKDEDPPVKIQENTEEDDSEHGNTPATVQNPEKDLPF